MSMRTLIGYLLGIIGLLGVLIFAGVPLSLLLDNDPLMKNQVFVMVFILPLLLAIFMCAIGLKLLNIGPVRDKSKNVGFASNLKIPVVERNKVSERLDLVNTNELEDLGLMADGFSNDENSNEQPLNNEVNADPYHPLNGGLVYGAELARNEIYEDSTIFDYDNT